MMEERDSVKYIFKLIKNNGPIQKLIRNPLPR
jgi:hypothetical protein